MATAWRLMERPARRAWRRDLQLGERVEAPGGDGEAGGEHAVVGEVERGALRGAAGGERGGVVEVEAGVGADEDDGRAGHGGDGERGHEVQRRSALVVGLAGGDGVAQRWHAGGGVEREGVEAALAVAAGAPGGREDEDVGPVGGDAAEHRRDLGRVAGEEALAAADRGRAGGLGVGDVDDRERVGAEAVAGAGAFVLDEDEPGAVALAHEDAAAERDERVAARQGGDGDGGLVDEGAAAGVVAEDVAVAGAEAEDPEVVAFAAHEAAEVAAERAAAEGGVVRGSMAWVRPSMAWMASRAPVPVAATRSQPAAGAGLRVCRRGRRRGRRRRGRGRAGGCWSA
ncbi:MAG: hypothetical protein H6705_02990 [Myxococcales bacterium]|nr:hypothetical protein [Myxococcales bacterium]